MYDWRARRELYRTPSYVTYDLQADGKLVSAFPEDRIVWHSPAEPQAHRIDPPEGRRFLAARIAGDRILAMHEIKYNRSPTLAVIDLDGRGRDIGAATDGVVGLDFDGRRATWSQLGCGRASIVLDPDVDDQPDPDDLPLAPELLACSPAGDQGGRGGDARPGRGQACLRRRLRGPAARRRRSSLRAATRWRAGR